MSDDKNVHEIAGGWITERKNTPIPGFLKLAYVGFCLFGLYYLFAFWAGETGHDTRGPLVRQINDVMQVPGSGWHGLIAVCLVAFVMGLLWFVFVHRAEE
ncbi:MAG: hypothetical protein U0599_23730 [Vicinamibacteria bacterium]